MCKIHTVPNINIVNSRIEKILETTSADIFWKSKKGNYLGVNHQFLKVSNLRSFDDVIGKKDTDFIWADQAHLMMSHDQEVIVTGNSNYYLEAAQSPQGPIIKYLNYKTPLKSRDGKKIIGVFGLSIPVTDADSMANGMNEIAILINKQLNKIPLTETIKEDKVKPLTLRQEEILFFLVKGFTIKEIAQHIHLASKTVEHYLNAIKLKLNCHSRSELIEKALKIPNIRSKLFS